MNHLNGACGLDCSACEAFVATQANDQPALQALLDRWVQEYGPMPFENVLCDGCMTAEGRHGGYCAACPVRACSQERGLEGCFVCSDYPCDKITTLQAVDPSGAMKERLERLRVN